jgi:hypothetical protein
LKGGPSVLLVDVKTDDTGHRYLAVWWDGPRRFEAWILDAEIEEEE